MTTAARITTHPTPAAPSVRHEGDTMTAQTLRDAAKVLRESAEAATPGPWFQDFYQDGELLDDGTGSMDDEPTPGFDVLAPGRASDTFPEVPYDVATAATTANAAYIATMHPDVGLALADWLDDDFMHQHGPTEHALKIADLILGGAA